MYLKYFISLHRYASDNIEKLRAENRLGTRSRFANWIPVTATEMEEFFAIIVNMGIIQIPNIEAYWSTSWTSEISFFSKVLRRDRFQQIFRLLHVSHDDIVVPVARINKVKALLDLLIPNFQASYNPSRDVSVDETMIGFRGRFSAKQYLLNKPTKYGVKAFTIADSSHAWLHSEHPAVHGQRHPGKHKPPVQGSTTASASRPSSSGAIPRSGSACFYRQVLYQYFSGKGSIRLKYGLHWNSDEESC